MVFSVIPNLAFLNGYNVPWRLKCKSRAQIKGLFGRKWTISQCTRVCRSKWLWQNVFACWKYMCLCLMLWINRTWCKLCVDSPFWGVYTCSRFVIFLWVSGEGLALTIPDSVRRPRKVQHLPLSAEWCPTVMVSTLTLSPEMYSTHCPVNSQPALQVLSSKLRR